MIALTRILRAGAELEWQGGHQAFPNTLAELIAENPGVASDVDDPTLCRCAKRTPDADGTALTKLSARRACDNGGEHIRTLYWEGVVAKCAGDEPKRRVRLANARTKWQDRGEPARFAAALSLLGMIDAGLGRKEEALREGRRACELLPISKDAIDGVTLAVNLAQIYAWTGERDLAIEQITAVQRMPNYLSYGFLKLHPFWNPLRERSAFRKNRRVTRTANG